MLEGRGMRALWAAWEARGRGRIVLGRGVVQDSKSVREWERGSERRGERDRGRESSSSSSA